MLPNHANKSRDVAFHKSLRQSRRSKTQISTSYIVQLMSEIPLCQLEVWPSRLTTFYSCLDLSQGRAEYSKGFGSARWLHTVPPMTPAAHNLRAPIQQKRTSAKPTIHHRLAKPSPTHTSSPFIQTPSTTASSQIYGQNTSHPTSTSSLPI